MHELLPYELKVLEDIVTEKDEIPWGAAKGAAIDFLQTIGYLTLHDGSPTSKAKRLFNG